MKKKVKETKRKKEIKETGKKIIQCKYQFIL